MDNVSSSSLPSSLAEGDNGLVAKVEDEEEENDVECKVSVVFGCVLFIQSMTLLVHCKISLFLLVIGSWPLLITCAFNFQPRQRR